MKLRSFLLSALALVGAVVSFAQGAVVDGAPLSSEEVRLIRDFRRAPEPYRRLLFAEAAPSAEYGRGARDQGYRDADVPLSEAVVGPRDVIDVVISDGKIAFWGKGKDYDPTSFRIARGETKWVSFFRDRSSAETRVQVSFMGDGLHFDIPEAFDGNDRHVRGLLVVPEDGRWNRGEPFVQEGKLTSSRSVSKAEGISIKVRYVSSRR